ncbi:hypothetical protein HDU83_006673 [Entophlyctis luteolus]|nr:hypothetical protein HDU83_006673 [Entophlyctis luteolus]
MAQINDLEMSNMEELEDLVTHNRNEEFHLLNKHAKAEAELLSNLEIQAQLSDAAELAEKQKSVQQSQLRAQKKQTAAIVKTYAVASKNREKMLICDNPILKGSDSAGVTEKDQLDIEGSVGSKLGMNLSAEDNAIIKISGERGNLGIITATNDNFNKLFGYCQGEIVGRNINMIVPSPFSELHDGFLRKYLETGSSRVIDVFQQVMGVHKDGYLLPIILCVKHNQEADGKRAFAGYIKATKESKTSGFVIFDSNTLRLKYATKNIEETFSFKVSQMGGSSFVGQLFPGLDETSIKEVSTHRGFETEVKVGDQVLNIRVRGDKMQVQEFALHICGVSFKQNGVEIDDEGALDLPMTFYEGDDTQDGKADDQSGHNGASNVENTEKESNAISEAGSERLRAMVHHHKTVLNELKRQHRAVFSQKSKEHRRKMSDLLKDHEEENEQLKVEQSAALKELLETQLQSAALQMEHPTAARKLSGSFVPSHIAEKLELGIEPDPERIKCLTLLVVEIADFKKFTDEIPSPKVFSILNELHAKFDDTIAKYPSLCKIDSTANVYLVAAGFPVSQPMTPVEIAASVTQVLECSTELQTLVKTLDVSEMGLSKKLSLQIGVHSGEATAGLIGTKVSHYSVFGDGVGIASQLCATSESGKVQVSRETIVALGENEKFEFELRGEVNMKGKGKITSYWLEEKIDKKSFVLVYVDDMVILSFTQGEIDDFKSQIKKHFSIKELGPAKHVLGLVIERTENGTYLGQPLGITNQSQPHFQ